MKEKTGAIELLIKERKSVFIFTVLFMIVHGEMVFNKLSWHDDICFLGGWNDALSRGRFTFFLLSNLAQKVAGTESLPAFNGLLIALCTASIGVLLCKMLKIDGKVSKVALLLICISLPTIVGNLGFMQSAALNFIGSLLAVVAAYYAVAFDDIKSAVFSVVLLAFAVGEYQCHLTLFLSVLLCGYTMRALDEKTEGINLLKTFLRYVVVSGAGLVLYIVLLKLLLKVYAVDLTSYAGMDTYGMTSLSGYIQRVFSAYQDFFHPFYGVRTMFPFHWNGWHRILMLSLILGWLINTLWVVYNKNVTRIIMWALTVLATPIVINFNIILYGDGALHSLHQYQYVCLFALILLLIENGVRNGEQISKKTIVNHTKKIISTAAGVFIVLMGIQYVRYANLCYMEAEVMQQQSFTYCSALISDIHNTEGYYAEIPVCYVNRSERKYPVNHTVAASDIPITNPYHMSLETTNSWIDYLYAWCNFQTGPVVDISQLSEETQKEIETMPRYPDDGSIKIVEDVLIINF